MQMSKSEIIQKERMKVLNERRVQKGKYVLYWMQASQRAEYNHALEFAILRANELRQPLIVFFGITDQFARGKRKALHFYAGRTEGSKGFC